jgi:outer membrane immunogenic protein
MSCGRGQGVFAVSEGRMKMKKLIIGSAVLTACMAGPATGADLPVEAPVYVERPAAVGLLNWTGFYFGANLGYARSPGSTDIMVAQVPLFSLSASMNGVIGGVQAGANWQTGNGVFGIEGDFQGASQSASSSMTTVDITGAIGVAGAAVTAVNNDKISSFGTLRGRIGIAAGRSLFYVTGGGAFWNWSSNLTVTGLGTASRSHFQPGGALGGGVEVAITDAWTVRGEYLYLQSSIISDTPFAARPDVVVNSRIRDNVFRIGINYMFFTGSIGCRPHVC